MNSSCLKTLRLGTAVVIAAACSAAAAQSAPRQSIEIRAAAPVRTDVRTLCREIDIEINDALVRVVQEVATPALVDVRFVLSGSQVQQVSVGQTHPRYERALRRAVRGLQCASDSATPQAVVMKVRFVDPFDRGTATAAATALVVAGASAPAR